MKLSRQIALAILFFAFLSISARIAFFATTPLAGINLLWIGVYFGCLLIGLVPIWIILQRRIIRRINALAAAVTRVRLGDLTQVVPVDSHDEFGALAENFNDMTRQLVLTQRTMLDARKLAEERLAELQSSIGSLSQGFVITNQSATVLQANAAVHEIIAQAGRPLSDPTATPTMEQLAAIFPTDIHFAETLAHSMQTRQPKAISGVAYGEGRFINIFISPVANNGETLGSALLLEDVTEERIQQRSRDEFFSIASHELRTPLTAIRGNMSMAKDYFPDAMKDATLRELVEDSQAASVRLIEIVNDFLDSSRLEQGKMAFTFGPVKLAPLIHAVCDDLKPLREQQSNTITAAKELGDLPMVWADEGRLRQVLYNLISNANKYAEHATITLSGQVEGSSVRIRVSDTGKGISAENQKLLFHKFQQASDSILTRDNTKGTGLGLYISKLLATNMHSDVVLEHSEPGKGSTFAITIPVATPEMIQKANVKPDPQPSAANPVEQHEKALS